MMVNMISDKDVEKLKETFATRAELSGLTEGVLEAMRAFHEAAMNEIKKLRGEMMAEFKAIKEENNDILDNHERRLDRLEDKVFN